MHQLLVKSLPNIDKHFRIDISIIVASQIKSRYLKGGFIFTVKELTLLEN